MVEFQCVDNRYRELVLMTRPKRVLSVTPGHAMVAVSTAGTGGVEAWGFYLKPDNKGSHVRDEVIMGGWGRYTTSSVIPIGPWQYANLLSEIGRWQGKQYILLYRDCTDFALAVLKAAGIQPPADTVWPGNLGDRFSDKYGVAGGRCLKSSAKPPEKAILPWRVNEESAPFCAK